MTLQRLIAARSFLRRFKQALSNPLKSLCGGSDAVVPAAVCGGSPKPLFFLARRLCGGGVGEFPHTPYGAGHPSGGRPRFFLGAK